MVSYDLRFTIESYQDDKGNWSWSCSDFNLLNYSSLDELFRDIKKMKLVHDKLPEQIPIKDKCSICGMYKDLHNTISHSYITASDGVEK